MTSGIAANFSIVTLGVSDLERSVRFYRDLGWKQRGDLSEGITWFKTAATWIGLFGYHALAEDAELEAPDRQPAYRGITLALSFNTEDEVDQALRHAVACGGTLVKAAKRAEWGGYSGYFADPDGHLWEAARAPAFVVDEDGRIEIG